MDPIAEKWYNKWAVVDNHMDYLVAIDSAVAEARADEREKCAEVGFRESVRQFERQDDLPYVPRCREISAAILARGKPVWCEHIPNRDYGWATVGIEGSCAEKLHLHVKFCPECGKPRPEKA